MRGRARLAQSSLLRRHGLYNLRREVAARYEKRFGVSLDPDHEVVATIGSKEGFSHMCLALLGPGDTAIVPAPSFPIHVYAIALASGNVITLDVRQSQAFLANIARFARASIPRPKILILNYPHNPTATVVEQDFFDEIVALAKKYHFLVISDFAYGDVCFDGYQPPSFLSAQGAKSVGVEFTTMSKGYNMAGWRVGFAAGNRKWWALSRRSRAITTTASSRRFRSPPSSLCGTAKRAGWLRSRVPGPPRRLGSRPETARLGRRNSPGPACSSGRKSPSPGVADGFDRLRDETAGRGERRRQPGPRVRRDGEGFLRLALVENDIDSPSRAPDRPLPEV